MKKGKRVLVVHGEKPLSSGKIHPNFIERLKVALKLVKKEKFDFVIITGGKTRRKFTSEAEMGKKWLSGRIGNLLLEHGARTTIQNIEDTKGLIEREKIKIGKIVLIASKKRIPRVKFLYRRIWPEIYPKVKFVGAKDFYPLVYWFVEWASYPLDVFDIKEKFILKITAKIFRNA